MTPSDKNEYKLKWHRFQQAKEKKFTLLFKNALQQQVRQYIKGGTVFYITSEPIYKVLLQLYKECGPQWAAKTQIHKIKKIERKDRMPMGFSERVVELMRNYYGLDLLNDSELMTAYSREIIVKVLSEAAQSGASFDEIVKELTKNPEFSAMRARRIARTETVHAANLGSLVNAKESGLKMNKEWLSILDSRTRHSHREIDGSIVGIDNYFNLNGVTMQQPGARVQDNGLPVPPEFTINCRCTLAMLPIRDSRGRLIRT